MHNNMKKTVRYAMNEGGLNTLKRIAKKYKLDEYAIKRIVGHAISDITESVYTERDIEWLHEEISKIPVL